MKKLLQLFILYSGIIAFGQTYGPNLVTNGDFSASGNWGLQNASITNGSGQIVVPAGGNGSTASSIGQAIPYVEGKEYLLKLKVNAPIGKFFRVVDNYGNIGELRVPTTQREGTGSLTEFTFQWTAGPNSTHIFVTRGSDDITIIVDDVEIREVNPDNPPNPDPEPNTIIYEVLVAAGDGVTDDTTLMREWLQTDGVRHYLPKGTYLVSDSLDVRNRGSLVIESHPEAKIKVASSFQDSRSIFQIHNVKDVFIDGVYIDASNLNPSNYSTETYGIRIEDADNVTVQNSNLFKMSKGGIHVVNSEKIRLLNNDILETRNYAIWVKDSEDVLADGNIISGDGLNQKDRYKTDNTLGQTPGMLFSDCVRVKALHNFINNFRNGGTKTEGCDYVLYDGNTVRDVGKDAIKVQGVENVKTVKYAKVVNNTTEFLHLWEKDGDSHIQLWDVEDFVISGNIINGGQKIKDPLELSQENGINVYTKRTDFITKRGVISNNTMKTLGSNGIYLKNASNIIIENNRIVDYATEYQNFRGMWLEDVDYLTISGNTLELTTLPLGDFYSSGIFFDRGSNSSVTDNTIINVKSLGIYCKSKNSDFMNFSGNTVIGAGAQAIYFRGLDTSTNVNSVNLNNNTIVNCGDDPMVVATDNLAIESLSITNNLVNRDANKTNFIPWLSTTGSGSIQKLNYVGNTTTGKTLSDPNLGSTITLIQQGEGKFIFNGNPENIIIAGIGATCINPSGGIGSTFYVKESGTGNTGWIAK